MGLSVLILGHEAGHFFVAKLFGLKIDEFGFGFPPRVFAKKKGETEYSLNWLPFGGFVRIAGENDGMAEERFEGLNEEEKKRIFAFQPAWKRSLIILAGVAINFLIGWFLVSLVLMIGTAKALVINDVQKNSPAEQVGILSGDVVKNFTDASSFIQFINSHRGEEIGLEITRGGENLVFAVVPRVEVPPGQGAVGVALTEAGEERLGFLSAVWAGLERSVIIAGLTFQAFYDLVKNLILHASLLPGVVGPVGIFSIAQETGRIGLIYLVQLIAIISLNLAVINLIPFPALDGGRFFMILLEKMKGSPISRKTEVFVNTVGFVFLILLMALLTVRDVSNWF
ncbi:MAG: M50 family metallopeptidase [bacterium]|nr:M50 family metallopeptidase [bacterium]